MNNIVTIHQVNYLPWIGFFNKIKNYDTFIMFDIADYEKNGVQNRNKIRTKDGWCYLTIPINKKYYREPFNTVKLSTSLGLIILKPPTRGKPSTTYSGALPALIEAAPLMRIAISCPGIPLL